MKTLKLLSLLILSDLFVMKIWAEVSGLKAFICVTSIILCMRKISSVLSRNSLKANGSRTLLV